MRNRAKNVSADGSGTEVKTLNYIYRNEPRFTIEKIKRTKGGSYSIYPKEVEEWQRISKFEGEELWKIKPKLTKGTDGTMRSTANMKSATLRIGQEFNTIKTTTNKKSDHRDFGSDKKIEKVRVISDIKDNNDADAEIKFEGLQGWWRFVDYSKRSNNTNNRKFFTQRGSQLEIIEPKNIKDTMRSTAKNIDKSTGTRLRYDDGTIIPASKMGNDFLKISEKDRNKKIPTPLKNLDFSPENKDFGRITDVFVGKDDLRPVMSLVNFDKEQGHIVCTDAHKLLLLSPKPFGQYSGLYYTPKEIKRLRKEIGELIDDVEITPVDSDAKYPNYLAVIPQDNLQDVKVDAQKLFYYSRVLAGAKKSFLENQEETKLTFLSYKKQIVLRIKVPKDDRDRKSDGYRYLGVNADFLSNSLKAFLQMYHKFGNVTPTMFNAQNRRAMVFDYTNKGNDLSSLSDMNGFLVMPTMLDYFDYAKDLDIGNNKDFGGEMPSLNLVYDLDTNMIYSNGGLYNIDEALGYKPRYIVSEHKKIESSEKSTNFGLAKRIKGLQSLYRVTKDEKLKKRIKGLKLLQKNTDDLPF